MTIQRFLPRRVREAINLHHDHQVIRMLATAHPVPMGVPQLDRRLGMDFPQLRSALCRLREQRLVDYRGNDCPNPKDLGRCRCTAVLTKHGERYAHDMRWL